jgi:hypothetical protein
MKAPGGKFGCKKEEAIAVLLTQRNIEEAAKTAGIGANTLLRWLKAPEFQAAYREARRAAFGQSIARLPQGSSAAAATLLKTMIDANTSASVKVRAAEAILNYAAKAIRSGREDRAETMKAISRWLQARNKTCSSKKRTRENPVQLILERRSRFLAIERGAPYERKPSGKFLLSMKPRVKLSGQLSGLNTRAMERFLAFLRYRWRCRFEAAAATGKGAQSL